MRLIDADALTKQLEEMADNEWNKSVGSSKGLEDAIDVVESMPTIKTFTLADIEAQYRKGLEKGLEEQTICPILSDDEVKQPCVKSPCGFERPHGEWIEHRIEYMNYFVSEYECSHCRDEVWQKTEWQFCPNCGASMSKKEGESE